MICITLREKMSPTPRLKSSGLPRYSNLGQISWCWKSLFLKISNLLRFKTVSRFVICITLREKMSPTPRLKSSGLPRYNNLGEISWCWKSLFLKISNLLRFKTVSRFVIYITLREKMSPTPRLKSSGLPRYNNLGQISWCWKSLFLKISNLLRFKTVSRFVICITLREKMSLTPRLKSSGLPRYNNLGQISWCWKSLFLKISNLLRFKTVSRFGIYITLQAKMSPTPSLKSSGLPRYNNLGQNSWCWKIVIFKWDQISKIVTSPDSWSIAVKKNGNIYNIHFLARQFSQRSHSGDDPIVTLGDKPKEKIFVSN